MGEHVVEGGGDRRGGRGQPVGDAERARGGAAVAGARGGDDLDRGGARAEEDGAEEGEPEGGQGADGAETSEGDREDGREHAEEARGERRRGGEEERRGRDPERAVEQHRLAAGRAYRR